MIQGNNRLGYIDSIRAIAVFLVVWQHVSENFKTIASHGLGLFQLGDTLDFGRMGVILFFCVSGFVIPSSLKGEKWIGVKCFIVKRFFRLYPAYWLSIPLGWFTSWYIWGKTIDFSTVLANITMVSGFFGKVEIEALYWTLQLELIFYFLCAGLFVLGVLKKSNILTGCSISLIGIFIYMFLKGLGGYYLLYLGIMFWGALYRQYVDGNRTVITKYALFGCWLIIVMFFPLWGYYKYLMMEWTPVVLKMIGGYSVAMVLFLFFANGVRISNRKVTYLGEISYSIYLFHPVIFYPIYKLAGKFLWINNHHLIIYIILSAVLSAAFSSIIYELIEKRYIEKAKKYVKRIH